VHFYVSIFAVLEFNYFILLCLTDSLFTLSGPKAWNTLPLNVRNISNKETFCHHLKTYFLPCFTVITYMFGSSHELLSILYIFMYFRKFYLVRKVILVD